MATVQPGYIWVQVNIHVKPECVEAFKAASRANAECSVREAGVARFDLIQQKEDHTRFCLIEVYRDASAPAAHKATAHYATWRQTVESMMAEPRSAVTFECCGPAH
ncbi:hypothetical protein PAPYR_4513 [Paratrimastix pyriformis]|uniref:ABM domain-containing protein n=1 Tax=Paratrimastix pyriformis TaxID=342808 RepID=A0ABQ8URU5_9EUKA|nr:hypothetical protein PAPYR_4513 [Paratrimastix pyriformis]